MLDFDTLCRQHFIVLFLLFTQLIAGSFLHPLPLVWQVQLSAFIRLFKALKAQVQPYYLLLKPVDGGSEAILHQGVIMLAACITLADVQYAPLFVGQTQ